MNFKEKMDKILTISELSIGAIEAKCGISNATLRNKYKDNEFPTKKIIDKLIIGLGINEDWWKTGKGDILIPSNRKDWGISEVGKNTLNDEDLRIALRALIQKDKTIERLVAEIEELKNRKSHKSETGNSPKK